MIRCAAFLLLVLLMQPLLGEEAAPPVIIPPQVMPASPGPTTTDAEATAALEVESPGMQAVKAAIQGGQLPAIQSAYLDYRRHASPARWKIMPSNQPAAPTGENDPLGDQVAAHYVLRGDYHYGAFATFMGNDFNWLYNPVPPSDPAFSYEFTWCEVARTESWEKLADAYWKTRYEKYAQAWVEQLEDFARKNPMAAGPSNGATMWRTLDSATRMDVTWPYCYFHFRDSPSFTPEAQWIYLKLIIDHAHLLMNGLANPARTGNWVTDECFGLYTIGALFPELKEAANWRDTAINRLLIEFNRMVPPDGMEAELTPGYHMGALGQIRGPYDLAKLNNLEVPANFKDKILAMYRASVLMMQQNGEDVCTNDSWMIDAKKEAKYALKVGDDPLLKWAATDGKEGTAPPDSTVLAYAGFYAMRSGWDLNDFFLFFRAGPPGIGHEHQDMLEVVLRAWNTELLFDPGTYPYDRSDWRRFTIGTASHNTIIVDGKWQHRPPNKVPVDMPVDNPWVTTPLFDFVSGVYDVGYQKSVYDPVEFVPQKWDGPIDKSITHARRVLYLRPYYALVLDTLEGTGTHTFDAHFHMNAPAGHVDATDQAAFSDRPDGINLGLFPLERDHLAVDIVQGQMDPLLGWFPSEHRPIPTVRFRKQQEAPAIFATLLYPFLGVAPHLEVKSLFDVAGIWAQAIATPLESMEISLVKDGSAQAISYASPLAGAKLQVTASGLVVRQPVGKTDVVMGAWGLSSYADGGQAFTLDAPGALVFTMGKPAKYYNGSDKVLAVSFTLPDQRTIQLPPRQWVDVQGRPTPAPVLFAPFVSMPTSP